MSYRRMLPFLLLNIVVSAVVVIGILWLWDSRQEDSLVSFEGDPEIPQAVVPLGEAPIAESAPIEMPEATRFPISEESGPEIHVVGAGETLGQISSRYDLSIEEIMTVNGMSNPNLLYVGQELTIPSAENEQAVVEEEPEPIDNGNEDALPEPIPTEPAGEGEAILEIAQVNDPGQLSLETVQIVNNGGRAVELSDWKLADQFGNYYTFSPITLFGDGAGIMIHTAAGQDSLTELYWGEEKPIWKSGEMVVLYDAEGTVQAEFQVP